MQIENNVHEMSKSDTSGKIRKPFQCLLKLLPRMLSVNKLLFVCCLFFFIILFFFFFFFFFFLSISTLFLHKFVDKQIILFWPKLANNVFGECGTLVSITNLQHLQYAYCE